MEITAQAPPRRGKVANKKAALRATISAIANKVPEFVRDGGIMTTRQWLKDNERAKRIAAGGLRRLSAAKLEALLNRMNGNSLVSDGHPS